MTSQEVVGEEPKNSRRRAVSVYQWYVLALMFLMYMLCSADKILIAIINEPLRHELHLSDSQLGLLSGTAYSVAFGLLVLPMGYLLDRFSRSKLVSATLALWSLLTTVSAVMRSYGGLLVARMGVGASETAAVPGGLSILADVFPAVKRATAVGIFYAAGGGGATVGFLVGGWVLRHYSWRAVFLFLGTPGLLLAALVALTVREPRRSSTARMSKRAQISFSQSFLPTVRNSALRNAIIGNTLFLGTNLSFTLWLASFLTRVHGYAPHEADTVAGATFGVGMTVGAACGGFIGDWFSHGDIVRLTRIAITCITVACAAAIAFSLASNVLVVMLCIWITAIAAGSSQGNGVSVIVFLADPNTRGSTLAVTKLVEIMVGTGVIPLFTGAVSDAIGGPMSLRYALVITACIFPVSAVFFFRAGAAARRLSRSIPVTSAS